MTRFITRDYSPAIARHLTEEGFPEPLARVLAARGIETAEDLKADWRAMLPPETLMGTTAFSQRHRCRQTHHGDCRLRLRRRHRLRGRS